MEPLEFSKTGQKWRLKRQIFCFCGMTVVSSTVFEREISCQHMDVKVRILQFFFCGEIWRYSPVGSISFWSGLSHLSLLYVWYSTTIGRWTAIAQVTSMRRTCGAVRTAPNTLGGWPTGLEAWLAQASSANWARFNYSTWMGDHQVFTAWFTAHLTSQGLSTRFQRPWQSGLSWTHFDQLLPSVYQWTMTIAGDTVNDSYSKSDWDLKTMELDRELLPEELKITHLPENRIPIEDINLDTEFIYKHVTEVWFRVKGLKGALLNIRLCLANCIRSDQVRPDQIRDCMSYHRHDIFGFCKTFPKKQINDNLLQTSAYNFERRDMT